MNAEEPLIFHVDGAALIGVLHRAANIAKNVGIVIVVGGPQYRVGSHRQFVLLARALANAGYSVLRFDYRGMGDADGESRSFEHVEQDIRAAIDALCARTNVSHVALWGLCDAASAILMYCAGDTRVRAVALANPWVRSESGAAQTYIRHYYLQRVLSAAFWRSLFSGRFRPLESLRDFFAKLFQANAKPQSTRGSFIERMRAGLAAFRGPVLLLISERDLTAKEFTDLCRDQAAWRELSNAARVKHLPLANADHTFSTRATLDASNTACIDWLRAQVG